MKKILIVIILPLLLFSCNEQESAMEGEIVARVFDDKLYYEDVIKYMPEKFTTEDSTNFMKTYIESWVTKKLVARIAENNVPRDDQEIAELLESYKNSLIIFKYEQNYVEQNLDTNIASTEMEEYYSLRKSDFIMDFNAIKCLFIIIPQSAPDLYKVRNWYRSEKENHVKSLDIYCNQYAFKYDDFDDEWVKLDDILNEMPAKVNDQEMFLRYNHSLEASDSAMTYFLKIYDYKLKNDTTPLIFIEDDIKEIILSKRKTQLIQKLEKSIFQDGISGTDVKIYN